MSILSDLIAGAIETAITVAEKQTQKQFQRAREALNRRIGPVNKGRSEMDDMLAKAKRDAAARPRDLDELEPRKPAPHDDEPRR